METTNTPVTGNANANGTSGTSTAEAAKATVRDFGNAASNVTNAVTSAVSSAAKTASNDVQRVAASEMATLRKDLDDFIATLPNLKVADLDKAKQQLLDKFESVRTDVHDYAAQAKEKIVQKVDASGEYLGQRPFKAVAFAAFAGLLAGVWISRKAR